MWSKFKSGNCGGTAGLIGSKVGKHTCEFIREWTEAKQIETTWGHFGG